MNVQAALWLTCHGPRCCLDLLFSSAVADLSFWHSVSFLAKPPKKMLSPSPSIIYCLFLTMTAAPSLKSVLVSFPSPPTHNLICVCVCLHIIPFQETNSTMSAWTAHIISVQNRSICILLSSLAVPCLLPPSCIVRDTTVMLFVSHTTWFSLSWSPTRSHPGYVKVF